MYYNNIKDYATKRNRNQRTVKKMIENNQLLYLEIKKKKILIDPLEFIKFIFDKININE